MKEGRNRKEKMTSRVVCRRRRDELGGRRRRPWRGDCDEERADPLVISSISKLKLSGDLVVACSFNAFFRNATKKEAAGAARGGC